LAKGQSFKGKRAELQGQKGGASRAKGDIFWQKGGASRAKGWSFKGKKVL